ncbi:MAG: hypothetical protein KGS46_13490, partial [Chloroflexi bacterium]|nr:hypothetical protein [Chloroflexota bacterium]
KSLSQRCYGAALPPHNNAEIVISAKNCFKKYCLRKFTLSLDNFLLFTADTISIEMHDLITQTPA